MANSLVSPGVQVTVIDESNYAPTAVGTVPFILLATAQDKTNASGAIAAGTTKANSGQIYTVGSQRELVNLFGLPVFPTDASGKRIYGSELAEYGLHAAYNVLDIISSAYIVRADIDLNQLESTATRPTASAAGGTLWLDSAATSWGTFEWNAAAQAFRRIKPSFIYNSNYLDNFGVPLTSYGSIGDYTIVGTNSNNPLYYKNSRNTWVLVGSTEWASSTAPAVQASSSNITTIVPGDIIKINNTSITIGASSDTALVTQINGLNAGAGITGVTATKIDGYFALCVTPASKSNGSVADGAIKIESISGTALTVLGIAANTYYGPITQFSAHSSVPQWKSINANPRPTGSMWVKTTNYNFGANLTTYRRNSVTNTWDLVPNLLYYGASSATFGLDPTNGGLGIAQNTLYTQYDTDKDGTAQFKTFIRSATGPTIVTGTASNPTLTGSNTFTIHATKPGSSSLTNTVTITVPVSPNNTVAGVAAAISAANLSYNGNPVVTATVNSNGNIVLTHPYGGTIYLIDAGTTLDTMGITADNAFVTQSSSDANQLILSNWTVPTSIIAQPGEPTAIPTDGTLWMYKGQEVDIMINSGHEWKGYQTVTDARGYNLQICDPTGPIISASKPTVNSMGDALTYGDLWVDTSNIDDYPAIWRWQSVSGSDLWVQIDLTDSTTENGIVFADARWDTDGTTNIFTDDIPLITDLLNSDYVDLDAPDPTLFPIGCLLFNTRRSSNNVKKYIKNYFNNDSFPLLGLPDVTDTWQSYSGKKWNNVPYFGRKAVRSVVVAALESAVDTNSVLREEGKDFNLLCSPGYVELLKNLKVLNDDRKNTGFIIGEVPMNLSTDSTTIENYLNDASGSGLTGEDGMVTYDPYTAVFYPGTAIMNSLDGGGAIAVPTSTTILRTFIRSDQIGEVWFAPAGNKRGVVDNVTGVGYIDRNNNDAFVSTGVPQELRDLLYKNQVNPITFFPGVGRINYGNHTRQVDSTALDRINVSRLVAYLRRQIETIVRPLVFEPNDKLTRDTAKSLIDKLLNDVTSRRGLYDHLVVCDRTNNTNETIDRNELHIDIAIEPVKAVEFIYIPVRLKGTGQIAAGNLAPSTPLG
jgi:hypothetical protein